jgi:mRNA-degrading endonuclease RelE of RelBE toxin-antitoxin system
LADYRIFETAGFLEDLASVPASQREQLQEKLTAYVYPWLRRSPRDHPQARALRGYRPTAWRWRLGDWRAFYHIDDADRTVLMFGLALRRDAY